MSLLAGARTLPMWRALGIRDFRLLWASDFGITPLSLALAGVLIDLDATAMFVAAGTLVVLTAAVTLAIRFPAQFDAPVSAPRPA